MDEIDVDYMETEDAAEVLAKEIRKYWNVRGLYPEVWVERVGSRTTGLGVTYQVRSNMLNGRPV